MSEISDSLSVEIAGHQVSAANAPTVRHLYHLKLKADGPAGRFAECWPDILVDVIHYLSNNPTRFHDKFTSRKFSTSLLKYLEVIHNNYYSRKYHTQSRLNDIDKAPLTNLADSYRSLLQTAAELDFDSHAYMASEAILGKNAYDVSVYDILRNNLTILNRLVAKRNRRSREKIPHIKLAAVECAQLYKAITAKEITKTKPLLDGNFTTTSGQFIWEVMSAIDPTITKENIGTAIDSLPAKIKAKRADPPEPL